MSSTTFPTRTSKVTPRATVHTVIAALAAVAVVALAVLAFTGVAESSPTAPAAVPASNEMPTPEWLKGYLDGQGTGGSGQPAAPEYVRPVNRGLR